MRKIPTVFRRDPENMKHVLVDQVTPGCEWVLADEGIPTRKWDGTCIMRDPFGLWWARREIKPGKPTPQIYLAIETDPATGKTVGWEPIAQSPFAKFHAEAVERQKDIDDPEYATYLGAPGTFELVGPKINKGPDGHGHHTLIRHGMHVVNLDFLGGQSPNPAGLMNFCRAEGWEGIVWHHPDGRMAKLKVRDIPKEP